MDEAPLNARQTLLWSLFDFSVGRGLEIGPLHNTAVPVARADVRYLDVFDRDQLIANWEHDPGVDAHAIPPIDYVLSDGDRVRSIPETIGHRDRFDWVMASHVIEHVPDAIGWLGEIADVVEDGGALVLAVPDRRYCFDLHRPGTTVGQMLQAHELGETVPSVRAVFDYKRGHASVRAPMVWANDPVGCQNRIFPRRSCYRWSHAPVRVSTSTATCGCSRPAHCSSTSSSSGRSAWPSGGSRRLIPTKHNQLEFYVVLRRLPRAGWDDSALAGEPVPASMPDWLAETSEAARDRDAARRQVVALAAEVGRLQAEVDGLTASPAVRVSRAWVGAKRRIRRLPGYRAARRLVRPPRGGRR